MYNDFFDLVWKNWTRPVLEVSGYKVVETETGYLVVANVLGIDKKNIELDLKGSTLTLTGTKELKEIDFTNKVNYRWDLSRIMQRNEVKNIEYQVSDGLAYIHINTDVKQNHRITIKYKD